MFGGILNEVKSLFEKAKKSSNLTPLLIKLLTYLFRPKYLRHKTSLLSYEYKPVLSFNKFF